MKRKATGKQMSVNEENSLATAVENDSENLLSFPHSPNVAYTSIRMCASDLKDEDDRV